MNQHNSPDSGGVFATAAPSSSSSSSMRANDTTNGERSSNIRREIEEILNEYGEGSNGNDNSSGNGNRNEDSSASIVENEDQSQQYTMRRPQTLGDVMREPGSRAPNVMVLEAMSEETSGRNREAAMGPKEDLWLSTADGRYNSTIIPLRVGEAPQAQIFYVHKHILLKVEYFEKALCGNFRESETQSIELPEEDPAIFHYLIAFLYEGRFEPIKPAASVLVPDKQKGKGKDAMETNGGGAGGIDSENNNNSDDSELDTDLSAAAALHRRQQRERQREWDRTNGKHPGRHRPNCGCPRCVVEPGPPCWSCFAPRSPLPPPGIGTPYTPTGTRPPFPHPPGPEYRHRPYPERLLQGDGPGAGANRRRPGGRARLAAPPPPPPPPPPLVPPATSQTLPPAPPAQAPSSSSSNFQPPLSSTNSTPSLTEGNTRLSTPADLRTWLLCYEHTLFVYILANKFLLNDFKAEIARYAIDMLESAGTDAAVPQVLFLCKRLWEGLPASDPLLKMVFARVGFLQPWRSRSSGYVYGSGNRDGDDGNGERINENGKRRRSGHSDEEGMTTGKEVDEESGDWLHQNPEIVTAVLVEMAARREEDFYQTQYQSFGLQGPPGMGGYMSGMGMGMGRMDAGGRSLPSMERPWAAAGAGGAGRQPGTAGGLGDMGGGGQLPWMNNWEPIRPNTLRPGHTAHHHHWQVGGR
ncbi:hypothetical protein NEUTE1DRAFT_125817 [Neurospora tetrasperma FGSC 2508]|uniref:BTB domain-containing protein n=1 Tax=Neurospora tetrasperma (strain FGSC 2508 / ATCC MYA-4615 / P0657) TaxID=510951 RepID=F8N1H8_NEUT8|nr:uncharacterized protein NEUTE1DRAFT_125817 [Neurospora tetrasperma FGSC 2508]EGO52309.1 hypothetical protein NEUTE1DRAFT_125817 [Neurospora tetrasperma FGSC 2508]